MNKRYLLFIILTSFLPFLYIFLSPGVIHTHDSLAHLGRIPAYIKAITDSNIPPRWAGDLNYGYGMPLFVFMYPLPYSIASFFWGLTKSIFLSFELTLFLSFLLSGIFFYLWAESYFKHSKIALLATMLYQFSPFRLVELVVRGSIGEIYAYTFLPLLFYGIQQLSHQIHKFKVQSSIFKSISNSKFKVKKTYNQHPTSYNSLPTTHYPLLIAISTMLLVLSHNTLSLVFFGIAILYVLVFCNGLRTKILSLCSMLLGLGLSAWYWLPALIERRYTYGDLFMKDLWREHFPPFWRYFTSNIFHDPKFQTGGITVFIGFIHITLIVIGIFFIFQKIILQYKQKFEFFSTFQRIRTTTKVNLIKSFSFALVLTLLSLFFMSPLSSFLWEKFSLIRQFQFSWRLLGVIVVAIPFLIPIVYYFIHSLNIPNSKLKIIYWPLICFIILSSSNFFIPPLGVDTSKSEDYYWNYPLDTTYFGETNVIWSAGPADKYPKSQIEIIDGTGTILNLVKKTSLHSFTIESTTGARIVDNTQYFPGWKVMIDGVKTDIQFQDPSFRGLITFFIPSGKYEVQVNFLDSPIRFIGKIISIASFFIFLALYFLRDSLDKLLKVSTIHTHAPILQTMNKILQTHKELLFSILITIIITGIFFYKTVFFGMIPFPGDSLISDYKPWRSESYLGYNPGSYPNKSQYPDTIRQIYPWKTLTISQMKNWQWPLWNPYNFSGTPLLANFQSAPFYPLNIFYFLFDQKIAWSFLIILQPFLSLIFVYWFARTIRILPFGSILAGIAFAYSQFANVWLEYNIMGHVTLWLPLALLSIEKQKEHSNPFWIFILIFSITSSLLAGHPQMFGYLIIFLCIYSLFRLPKRSIFKIFIIPLLISLGIGSIQLIPGIELIINSARSPHSYQDMMSSILIQPWHLIMSLVPDFFGSPVTRNYSLPDTYIGKVLSIGIPTLVLASSTWKLRDNALVKFFICSSVVVLILITKNPFTMILYALPLPFVSSSSPNLMGFIFTLSIALLGGIGLDEFTKYKNRLYYKKILMPFIGIFCFLWLIIVLDKIHAINYLSTYLTPSFRNCIVSSVFFSGFILIYIINGRFKGLLKILPILIIGLLLIEQFFFFKKFNPFVPDELVFPENAVFAKLKEIGGIDRFWGMGSAQIDANFATQYNLFSPDGYDPLYPTWYGEFIHASKDGKLLKNFTDSTRSDAFITQANAPDNFADNPYRIRIINNLGIKYILDRVENNNTIKSFPEKQFVPIWSDNGWIIFKNQNSYPRALFIPNTITYGTKESFETNFFSDSYNVTNSILTEYSQDFGNIIRDASINIASYTPNIVKLSTKSDDNGYIFISDTWYPGWVGYVDGVKTNVIRANYTFRALPVLSGIHTVQFSFEPITFWYGIIISGISILVFIVYIGFFDNKT